MERDKNQAAVALARMRRGITERTSPAKQAAAKKNLALARAARWPKKETV